MAKTSQLVKSARKPKFENRHVNRCHLCGRRHSYMRLFGVCRICFRKLAHNGELPGVTKSNN